MAIEDIVENPLQKYLITCWLFQQKVMKKVRTVAETELHRHHIKPKAKYPKLQNVPDNIIRVPAILHAVLHEWLHLAFVRKGQKNDAKRFDVSSNVLEFANKISWRPNIPFCAIWEIEEWGWEFILEAAYSILIDEFSLETEKKCQQVWNYFGEEIFATYGQEDEVDILDFNKNEIAELVLREKLSLLEDQVRIMKDLAKKETFDDIDSI